jgi:hypothetical protein
MNCVHRQGLHISALNILLREVLFTYKVVQNPVARGKIHSRLIKLLVQDKEEYATFSDMLRR